VEAARPEGDRLRALRKEVSCAQSAESEQRFNDPICPRHSLHMHIQLKEGVL